MKVLRNILISGISIVILLLYLISFAHAATYDYYFKLGEGAGTCLVGDPCSTLAHANTKVDDAAQGDIVNLHFNGGDTWTVDSAAVGVTSNYGIAVYATDPTVNIDSYGSGKAIFDGNASDFTSVPVHDSGGPTRWNNYFDFERADCSIDNVTIQNVYGHAIMLNASVDSFVLQNSTISNIGRDALNAPKGAQNCTITKNLINNGQMLYLNGKEGAGGTYAGGIDFFTDGTPGIIYRDNLVSYNVVYDIYGEGITNPGGITEYNIVGSTGGRSIYIGPASFDAIDAIARYNFVIHSDVGNLMPTAAGTRGIAFDDEDQTQGDNSNADIEIYGNVIVNQLTFGIWLNLFQGTTGDAETKLKSIKVYNNTVIDCDVSITIGHGDEVTNGYIYNNSSIHYDTAGAHVSDWTGALTSWDIDTNHYYPVDGSNTVDSDWRTNYVTTDPKLYGEEKGSPEDWDGQTAGDPRGKITFADCYPNINGGGIGNGKVLSSYDLTFLTLGTDFSVLPSTQTFKTSEQSDLVAYDIGAAIRSLSYGFNVDDGAIDVSVDVVLSWTNQGDTTGVDGYFNAGSCPIGAPTKVIDDVLQATYDPTLVVSTTYCYTVDPHNSNGETEAGKDIEFTTAGGPPVDPSNKADVLWSIKGVDVEYSDKAGEWK